jgi:very-short-patch-repair endonuclease
MKAAQARAIIKDCIDRGWHEHNGTYYPPQSAEAKRLQAETAHSTKKKQNRSKGLKRTYDTNDHLNIANKAKHCDQFTRLLEIELNIEVWPEFRFSQEKGYKLDYALPSVKIGVECQGGIWKKGLSGHSSGKGISRDMAKLNLLTANGWHLIQVTSSQLLTSDTIELIKKAINNKKL